MLQNTWPSSNTMALLKHQTECRSRHAVFVFLLFPIGYELHPFLGGSKLMTQNSAISTKSMLYHPRCIQQLRWLSPEFKVAIQAGVEPPGEENWRQLKKFDRNMFWKLSTWSGDHHPTSNVSMVFFLERVLLVPLLSFVSIADLFPRQAWSDRPLVGPRFDFTFIFVWEQSRKFRHFLTGANRCGCSLRFGKFMSNSCVIWWRSNGKNRNEMLY